jgi:hypothetical protein
MACATDAASKLKTSLLDVSHNHVARAINATFVIDVARAINATFVVERSFIAWLLGAGVAFAQC